MRQHWTNKDDAELAAWLRTHTEITVEKDTDALSVTMSADDLARLIAANKSCSDYADRQRQLAERSARLAKYYAVIAWTLLGVIGILAGVIGRMS